MIWAPWHEGQRLAYRDKEDPSVTKSGAMFAVAENVQRYMVSRQ